MEIRSIILLSICVACALGGHIESGRCPVLPESREFDLNKFQGEWKSISRLPSDIEKDDLSCESIKYTYKFDHRVEFLIRHKNSEKMVQQSFTGEKTYIKNMLELRKDHFSPEYHHWMFQYQNYTYGLLVSCSEALGLFHIEKVWIVSRSSTIDQSALGQIRNDLSRMGLGSRKFSQVSHEDCDENESPEYSGKEEDNDDQETDGYEFFEIIDDDSDPKREEEIDRDDQSNKIEKLDTGDEIGIASENQKVVQSDANDSDSESEAKVRSEENLEDKKLNATEKSNDQKVEKDDISENEELTKENQRSGEDIENQESTPLDKNDSEDGKTIEQQIDQNQDPKSDGQSEKVNTNHKREAPLAYERRDNQGMMINQSPQSGNNFQQQDGFKVIYDRGDGEQSFGNADLLSQQSGGSNLFNPSMPINFAPANNVIYDRNEGNPGYSTYSTDQYQVIQPYDISAYLEIIERWKQERTGNSDSSSSGSSSNSGGNSRSESDRERLKQIKERGGLTNSAADIKRQKEKQKQILKQRGFNVRAGKEKAGGPGVGHGHRHRRSTQ